MIVSSIVILRSIILENLCPKYTFALFRIRTFIFCTSVYTYSNVSLCFYSVLAIKNLTFT